MVQWETMRQTLYLHIGGGKTGSSAIQNYLELNADALENYGIAYLNKVNISSPYQITSGNGIPLVNALLSNNKSADIETLIKSYILHYRYGICSSEMLSELSNEHFLTLIRNADRINVDIFFIMYVRDVAPYFMSAYDQSIKRHGECRPFKKWVTDFDYKHFSTLNEITKIIDKECIKVIHYETSKTDLIGSFLGIIGVNISTPHNREASIVVNRSLCREERSAIRAVNRITGGLYSTDVSDMLIYINPNITSDKIELDYETANYLQTKFKNKVSWLNKRFFNGKNIVSIHDNVATKTIKQQNNILRRKIIHETITELSKYQKKLIDYIIQFCEDHNDSYIINKHRLPDDFNCIGYLAINRDVFLAKVDPFYHYIRYGMTEGRQYKHSNVRKI